MTPLADPWRKARNPAFSTVAPQHFPVPLASPADQNLFLVSRAWQPCIEAAESLISKNVPA